MSISNLFFNTLYFSVDTDSRLCIINLKVFLSNKNFEEAQKCSKKKFLVYLEFS